MTPDRAVVLDAIGERKIDVIRVVRAHLDLDLVEAKTLVERAPCTLIETLEGHRAAAFVSELVAAGASARVA